MDNPLLDDNRHIGLDLGSAYIKMAYTFQTSGGIWNASRLVRYKTTDFAPAILLLNRYGPGLEAIGRDVYIGERDEPPVGFFLDNLLERLVDQPEEGRQHLGWLLEALLAELKMKLGVS